MKSTIKLTTINEENKKNAENFIAHFLTHIKKLTKGQTYSCLDVFLPDESSSFFKKNNNGLLKDIMAQLYISNNNTELTILKNAVCYLFGYNRVFELNGDQKKQLSGNAKKLVERVEKLISSQNLKERFEDFFNTILKPHSVDTKKLENIFSFLCIIGQGHEFFNYLILDIRHKNEAERKKLFSIFNHYLKKCNELKLDSICFEKVLYYFINFNDLPQPQFQNVFAYAPPKNISLFVYALKTENYALAEWIITKAEKDIVSFDDNRIIITKVNLSYPLMVEKNAESLIKNLIKDNRSNDTNKNKLENILNMFQKLILTDTSENKLITGETSKEEIDEHKKPSVVVEIKEEDEGYVINQPSRITDTYHDDVELVDMGKKDAEFSTEIMEDSHGMQSEGYVNQPGDVELVDMGKKDAKFPTEIVEDSHGMFAQPSRNKVETVAEEKKCIIF